MAPAAQVRYGRDQGLATAHATPTLVRIAMSELRASSTSVKTSGRVRTQRLVRGVGILLVLLSLGFVGQRLYQHLAAFLRQFGQAGWLLILLGLLVFTSSQLLLSLAWHLLLRWQGVRDLRALDSHVLFGRAQISKYIPGNVFQYVARHLAFRRLGVADGTLLFATAYETLSFVVAAGLLAALGLPFYARHEDVISPPIAALASVVAAAGLLGLVRFGRPLLKLVGRLPSPSTDIRVTQVLAIVPLHGAFVATSGCLAALLFLAVGGDSSLAPTVVFAYALAWLSGYVVPGASGGIGIREATLLVLLGDTPQALFVALGMRVITTLGEVVWFFASTLIAHLQRSKS